MNTLKIHEIYDVFEKAHRKLVHGSRINDIRDRENLTQAALGEKLGITEQVVSYVERGERLLSEAIALKLHLEYGYSLDWIYGISDIPKEQDRKYFIDIREIVKIDEGKIHISIKSGLFDYLEKLGNLEKRKADGHLSNSEYKTLVDDLDHKFTLDFCGSEAAHCCVKISTSEIAHRLKLKKPQKDIVICTE